VRILVVGASGYIGGRLVPLLAARGHELVLRGERVLDPAVHERSDIRESALVEAPWGDRNVRLAAPEDLQPTQLIKTG
jgi:uncharacterized protein YbjT (DUF2867 family)